MSALRRIDKALAIGSWLTVSVLVVMLFLGPAVIANDDAAQRASTYSTGAAPDGASVFKGNCGSCHTLSAAGTSGTVGPNLDNASLSASEIESVVRDGRGAMPSFSGRLSDAEIKAVAAFVSASH